MTHKVNNDFLIICKEILEENKSEEEWAEIESDDMFQKGIYEGGFDATEMLFCFSVYDGGQEYWFDFSLNEAAMFQQGLKNEIDLRNANY